MNRIEKAMKKPVYIGYLTAGDGGRDYSEKAFLALIAGGVDIIEVGIPFSDPVADGPVIQRAHKRALQSGMTMENVFTLVRNLRKQTEVPIILFSYLNPILSRKNFFREAKEAGADGVLIVDLPVEGISQKELDPILLITPNTTSERIDLVAKKASGFLYYVCQRGTTGERSGLSKEFAQKMAEIKAKTSLPVVAGFGISSAKMAKEVLQYADGFVVGSFLVKAIEEKKTFEEIKNITQAIDPRKKR